MAEEPGVITSRLHVKPPMTAENLIELLEGKGVTFDLISRDEAIVYLKDVNNFLRAASYRKLYPVKVGGPEDGKYIGLDFAALVALSSIDRQLRSAFREISIDVEHFARVELLQRCVEQDEDGYAIVEDFFMHLRERGNTRAEASIRERASNGKYPDPYSGDLIEHYVEDLGGLSVWALLEVVEFGRFADFWLFCAKRWSDEKMVSDHYVLRATKDIRNACCHNSCIVNGLSLRGERANFALREPVTSDMKRLGLKNTKSRRAKLANLRVAQIAAALYAASRFCDRPSTRAHHIAHAKQVRSAVAEASSLFPQDGSLDAYFDFIFAMIDIWLVPLP